MRVRQLVLAIAMLCASASVAHAEADDRAIAREALKHYIRPFYAELAQSAAGLQRSVDALCREPSTAVLKIARESFAATVEAWSKVEPIRFGPVAQDHRYERIFYWPDPKGIGIRQLREALAMLDQSVTDVEALAGKSVALQGLPPLEFLLSGEGAEVLIEASSEAAFRCRFAASVAANLARIAGAIMQGWQDDAPYTKAYLEPGPDNPTYRDPKEVTLDLFKTFIAGIETVRDQKLAKTLGAKPEQARSRLAPFWRSGLSFTNMADNLEGVRDLFAKGGFAAVVQQESPGVEASILFDLDHAIEVLHGIDVDVPEAVRDEALRAKLEALRVSLKSAATTSGDMIARGAGLSFGFNAMDGD